MLQVNKIQLLGNNLLIEAYPNDSEELNMKHTKNNLYKLNNQIIDSTNNKWGNKILQVQGYIIIYNQKELHIYYSSYCDYTYNNELTYLTTIEYNKEPVIEVLKFIREFQGEERNRYNVYYIDGKNADSYYIIKLYTNGKSLYYNSSYTKYVSTGDNSYRVLQDLKLNNKNSVICTDGKNTYLYDFKELKDLDSLRVGFLKGECIDVCTVQSKYIRKTSTFNL